MHPENRMKPDPQRRAEVDAAIAEHLQVHGPRDWSLTSEKFPDISRRAWFRAVARVKAAPPAPKALRAARRAVRGKTKSDLLQAMEAHAPTVNAPPSPGHIAKVGVGTLRDLDFMAEALALYREAEALRDQAMTQGPDGSRRITSPRTYTKSMSIRRDLIETCLKLVERAYDVEQTRRFYDALIDELRQESPELVERIAARMMAANDRWGFSAGPFA
jgi:hypothetical protein